MSLMFFTYMWSEWKMNEIAAQYPKVFNVINIKDINISPGIVKDKIVEFDNKISSIEGKIVDYQTYLNDVLRSKFYLLALLNEIKKLSENYDVKFYVEYVESNPNSFYVRFYEFSKVSHFNPESFIQKLKLVYVDPSIYLSNTKNLYGDFKMFEYVLEGNL